MIHVQFQIIMIWFYVIKKYNQKLMKARVNDDEQNHFFKDEINLIYTEKIETSKIHLEIIMYSLFVTNKNNKIKQFLKDPYFEN